MPTYDLVRWVVRRKQDGTARVNLHGKRSKLISLEVEKHIDYMILPTIPDESDTDLVRCAVAASPNKWKVGLRTNLLRFGGKFGLPLGKQLKATLKDAQCNASTHAPK